MPMLWNNSFNGLQQFEATTISKTPQPKDINRSNKRLGKLAEDLFSFWVSNNTNYSIVFENLQIINNKQTLGELDVCLYSLLQKKYIHLELITKFYLYNPAFDCNSIEAWIGPNRNDSLKNKIEKLKDKQLPLFYSSITKKQLSNYNIDYTNTIQQVCFKAFLFVPVNFNGSLTQFNTKSIVGNYMTFDAFKSLHSDIKKYHCPTKQDWLRDPSTQNEWFSFEDSVPQIKLFIEAKQAIMVWSKNKTTYKRTIIVPYSQF